MQHRSDTVCARHQTKSQPRQSRIISASMGTGPSWAKDSSKAAAMINARSETAARKPTFCDALKFRRCLIPADGFYEWQRIGKAKQPYCFEVNRAELFSFAGLRETWNDTSGSVARSGHNGYDCGRGILDAIRCSADAVASLSVRGTVETWFQGHPPRLVQRQDHGTVTFTVPAFLVTPSALA
jgi:hypothetical protein